MKEQEELLSMVEAVLRLNAIHRTNMGKSSTDEDKEFMNAVEEINLAAVRHFDPALIDSVIKNLDD